MAKIELVIKIDEKVRAAITRMGLLRIPDEMQKEVDRAIQMGKPLPKGHGRLKDFDKIEWYGCDFEGKACEKANGDCSVCNFGNCYAGQLRELPTIIGEDKER